MTPTAVGAAAAKPRLLAVGEWCEVTVGIHAGRVCRIAGPAKYTAGTWLHAVELGSASGEPSTAFMDRAVLRPLSRTAPRAAQSWRVVG